MTVTMIANKRMYYATRMLQPGERFEAKPAAARLFAKVGRARHADAPAVKAAPTYPKVPPHDAVTLARAEYERVFGKRPHMGWDVAELRKRIAAGPAAPRTGADLLSRG